MCTLAWQDREVRRLLRLFNRPSALEQFALAAHLRAALNTSCARDAVMTVIEGAFDSASSADGILRHIVQRCDIEERVQSTVWAELHLSRRSFFRLRANAIAGVAAEVNRLLARTDDLTDGGFTARLARAVAPFDGPCATTLYDALGCVPEGRAAYDALRCRLVAGLPPATDAMRVRTRPWTLLARLQIAKWHSLAGRRRLSLREQCEVGIEIQRSPGRHHDPVAFDLADIRRIDALERGDVGESRFQAGLMRGFAGGDKNLIGQALVAETEQSCEELDFDEAQTRISGAQMLAKEGADANVLCRAAYGTALVSFMRQRWEDALAFASAAVSPLSFQEPRLAMSAATLAGRAAFMLGRQWAFPHELCARYPHHPAVGYLQAVRVRHLALNAFGDAVRAATHAAAVCKQGRAPAYYAYALSANAVALMQAGLKREADNLLMLAWQHTNLATLSSAVVDQFVHDRLPRREFGPFSIDEQFLSPVRDRVIRLVNGIEECKGTPLGYLIASFVGPAITRAIEQSHPDIQRLSISTTVATLRNCRRETRNQITSILRSVAWTLASCLQPQFGMSFATSFGLAISSWLPVEWASTMAQSA